MSRIGRMPITVPAGVEVTIAENNVVTVKGPKGTLVQALRPEMILEQEGNTIHVKRPSDDKLHCALHGMPRALLHLSLIHIFMFEIAGVSEEVAREALRLASHKLPIKTKIVKREDLEAQEVGE